MTFLKNIKDSVYNPAYYRELLSKPFSYSLKFFASLALCIALISSILTSVSVLPMITSFVSSIGPKINAYYPAELEIKIKDGLVSTNVAEPYLMKAPADFNNVNSGGAPDIENFIVIDTKNPVSIETFREYNTIVLLTRDSIMYMESSNGKIVLQSLESFPDYTLNKSSLNAFITKFDPYLKFIPPIVVFGIFFFSFIGLLLNLVYLFILALLVWLITKIKKLKVSYWKSYQMSLHLATLGLILDLALQIAHIGYPFVFTVVTLILAILNIKFGKDGEVSLAVVVSQSPDAEDLKN